ncbi:hypothetical protein PIB30_085294 [Stylosanthes scabra]|uniref:Uncharacterized protein n=1 Tax=Stylosanthes scabra TaxID=79078 RepID=A0ABU6SU87_9FABA|nr:hypothetical protein [Stylosanthes scabra]
MTLLKSKQIQKLGCLGGLEAVNFMGLDEELLSGVWKCGFLSDGSGGVVVGHGEGEGGTVMRGDGVGAREHASPCDLALSVGPLLFLLLVSACDGDGEELLVEG